MGREREDHPSVEPGHLIAAVSEVFRPVIIICLPMVVVVIGAIVCRV